MTTIIKPSIAIATTLLLAACNFSGTKENKTTGDSSATTAATAAATQPENWQVLFNGRSLDGWHVYGTDSVGSAWKAEDSVLHLDASQKNDWQTKGGGDIVTDDEYENFHLKLDWKISQGGNSGIIFYVHEDTSKFKYAWESGPEMQVADNAKNEDGKIKKHMAGDLYDLISSSKQAVKPAGEWNHVEIISNNGKLDLFMNGINIVSTTMWDDNWKSLITNSKFKTMPGFGTFRKGRICLQDHGADVWFKNMMVKKI